MAPVSAQVPLFNPGQMAGAAFFGTLLASAWLARANLVALGKPEEGNSVLVKGVLATAAIMALAFVLPEQVPGTLYAVPQLFLAKKLADKAFGPLMATHPRASPWRVVGVCLVSLQLVLAVGAGIAVALDPELLTG